jgi:two-component system sensor histidine kinase KdpD
VVIGYLEPHDRPDTTAQAEGLEQLPRRTVTFPDTVLASADEIVLVDLTPQALTQRLREGKVYPPDRVPSALNGFFRVENLAALREVALRQVAEDVENKRLVPPIEALGTREEQIFGDAPPPVAERILVLVEPDERSRRLVRRAWRSSQRLAAELDLLYVASPGNPPRGEQRERLEELRRLASILDASILDATFIVEEGDDVADTAARIATDRGTTYLIIGQSHPREATDRHLDSRCARCGPEPVRVA